MPKLKSTKQEAFAQHYALHGKPADAYRHSYNTGRMKPNTIYVKASELLRDGNVAVRIKELQEKASEQAEKQFAVNAEWMLERLKSIDDMDVADIMDDAGNVKPISQWPKIWRTSISGLDVQELIGKGEEAALTIVKKLKMPDKLKNLEMLGRHVEVQAFKDRHEHTGDPNNPIQHKVDASEVVDAVRSLIDKL